MTDLTTLAMEIPDELVARVCEIMCCEGLCSNEIAGEKCTRIIWREQAQAAIRAVLDWRGEVSRAPHSKP